MSYNLIRLPSADSTNNRAKALAQAGCEHKTVVIADEQTQGRGRLGRSFYSPSGEGIYMSIILRNSAISPHLLTPAAAVAVRRAILAVTGLSTDLKWVNDIYYNNKKICGILVEASVENSRTDFFIVGIGVNTSVSRFPDKLINKAGTLSLKDKEGLIQAILYEFDLVLQGKSFMDEYIEHSMVIGKRVLLVDGNSKASVLVKGITEDGHLLVLTDDGISKEIFSGEVSLLFDEVDGL